MTRIRLMTWNIHGAVGRNPRHDLSRVVELVRCHGPDIVALQEIDSRRARTAEVGNPFKFLRHALGRHGADAHAISGADGDYGQALFSRWPLAGATVHDLSYPEREPRRAIVGEVSTPFGPLRVVATHLGLSLRERRSQTLALLGLLGTGGAPTVALGDFNDWFWPGSVRRTLEHVLPGFTRHRTFPAFLPMFRLDRVFVSGPARLIGSVTDRRARHLSDHLPIIADIVLAPHASMSAAPVRQKMTMAAVDEGTAAETCRCGRGERSARMVSSSRKAAPGPVRTAACILAKLDESGASTAAREMRLLRDFAALRRAHALGRLAERLRRGLPTDFAPSAAD